MLLDFSYSWPDLQTMLSNLATQADTLKRFMVALSYMTGFVFTFRAVYQLKEYGELRTMMSSQTNVIKPMLYLFIGAALVYFPSLYWTGMETIFGQSHASPIAYDTTFINWGGTVAVVGKIVQLVGFISFFRGWVLLAGLGGHSAPHGSMGKAITHIIGGILAMNIVATTHLIESSIGFSIT